MGVGFHGGFSGLAAPQRRFVSIAKFAGSIPRRRWRDKRMLRSSNDGNLLSFLPSMNGAVGELELSRAWLPENVPQKDRAEASAQVAL
jgi:hypothetical protein